MQGHRVTDPADPNRCKAAAPDGQCSNRAEHGSEYCLYHGGKSTASEEDKRSYLLAQAQDRMRLAQLTVDQEPIRELRDAIALTHMLIERRYNMIQTEGDLLAACGPLNQLLLTMERLVKSAEQLKQSLGAMLAKQTVLRVAQEMCQVVAEELEGIPNYELIVDRVVDRVVGTIQATGNPVEKPKALTAS